MRLIATFDTEQQAYVFYSFLLKQGVQNIYEAYTEQQTSQKGYRLWIVDEEDFQSANDWLALFRENPQDPRFLEIEPPLKVAPTVIAEVQALPQEEQREQEDVPLHVKVRGLHFTLTHLLLILCIAVFFWNNAQKKLLESESGPVAVYLAHTTLEKTLLFDYPLSFQEIDTAVEKYAVKEIEDVKQIPPPLKAAINQAERVPSWRGLYPFFLSVKREGWQKASHVPLFEKIRQGEVWRLFTPCLLHFDFLHILFNMAWLWILGKQIEERIHWKKMGLLILAIGIVSNTAQYMASGPSFLGFSGIVVGMAGFIWMRQRKAAWEGYPLSRMVIAFLLLFVVAMVFLGILSFTLRAFSLLDIAPIIANTAHVGGGICGILLGRLSFFARGKEV
jgi:GlpG protein